MSKWKLYWVMSNGEEDCFVVAKNSRSACAVDKYGCWFLNEIEDFDVIRVMDISNDYELLAKKRYCKINKKEVDDINGLSIWPDYATDWLLKKLGADIRIIDNKKEFLIDDIVYAPGYVYPIGKKMVKELLELDSELKINISNVNYDDLDKIIEMLLGRAMIIIHRIENYISESYIFGVWVERFSNYSIFEIIKFWKDKFTFGKLINLMEENFIINSDIKNSLQLFLTQSNKIAHGLTIDERYDINTIWGKRRS